MLFFFPPTFPHAQRLSASTSDSSEIFMRFSKNKFCVSAKNLHRAPESDEIRPTHTVASNLSIRVTQSVSQSSFIMFQEPVYTSFRRTLVSLPVTPPIPSSRHFTTVTCTLVVFKLIELTTWLQLIYLSERVQQAMIAMLMHLCGGTAWKRDLGDRLHCTSNAHDVCLLRILIAARPVLIEGSQTSNEIRLCHRCTAVLAVGSDIDIASEITRNWPQHGAKIAFLIGYSTDVPPGGDKRLQSTREFPAKLPHLTAMINDVLVNRANIP